MLRNSLVLAAAVAAASAVFAGTPVLDGTTNDAVYGPQLYVQTTNTQFGNSTTGNPGASGGGSEINNVRITDDANHIYVALAGNLETNFNRIVFFVDADASASTGSNVLSGGTFNNYTFPAGFGCDAVFRFTNGNSPTESYLNVERYNGLYSDSYIGGFTAPSATAAYSGNLSGGGAGWYGPGIAVPFAFDHSNTAGVAGFGTGTEAADPVAAAAVNTGLEIGIPKVVLAGALQDQLLTGDTVRIIAVVTGGDFASNQVMPPLVTPKGNIGGGANFSTPANALDDNFIAYTLTADGPPPNIQIGVSSADVFYANNFVRVAFNTAFDNAATGDGALNPANYTFNDGLTVTSVAQGTGARVNEVFLTLSGDILATTELTLGVIGDANGVFSTPGAQVFEMGAPYSIITATVNSTADTQEYLPNPAIRGDWDGFSNRWPLTDGEDAYPDVPGAQIEAGDTLGDKIYAGRIFTRSTIVNANFVVASFYEFNAGVLAPGKTNPRDFNAGHWGPNWDRIWSGGNIAAVDIVDNRLTANPVNVTINVAVPIADLRPGASPTADLEVFASAGPTFGSENALPTLPNTTIPGETDVTGGLRLTYVNSDATFHNYRGTVTYPDRIPDVGGYRLGYRDNNGTPAVTTDDVIYREEEGTLIQSDLAPATLASLGWTDSVTYKNNTVHPHIARIQSIDGSRSIGRTLNLTLDRASYDVPPATAGPVAEAQSWTMYE
ncbi:MAG: hypothetical protein SF028_04030 [Candidatus Sumerlaeia bacterium]|nr:hypothetical protein [Candidatus Sumerlaeia bacterium]